MKPTYCMSCYGFPTEYPLDIGNRILPTSQRFGPLGDATEEPGVSFGLPFEDKQKNFKMLSAVGGVALGALGAWLLTKR